MTDNELNLAELVLAEMKKMGFEADSIARVTCSRQYRDAGTMAPSFQKSMLTMVFFEILLGQGGEPAPAQIRMALSAATDTIGWLDDMKLVILPFLKENENKFF